MSEGYLLGIDVGTQSTRAALISMDGKVVASVSMPQEMVTPNPGWAEQNPQTWWEHTLRNIRQLTRQAQVSPQDILSIGVSGQMHGTIPLNGQGELLSHSVQLWCDKRSAELVESFKYRAGTEKATLIAGSPPVANWVGFKMLWIKHEQPELYDRTWKFVLPKDYINFKLTGEIATDHSEASGTFLMDALSQALASEVRGLGIAVNAVLPGTMDTTANRRAMPDADRARWVSPDHVAAVIAFLCSDEAAAITGAAIPVG